MSLTKDEILSKVELPRVEVPVPEWGGSVWVRGLTGWERDLYESQSMQMVDGEPRPNLLNARGRLAVLVICGEDGKRIFADEEAQSLGRKWSVPLDRILDAAKDISGIKPGAVEDAKGN